MKIIEVNNLAIPEVKIIKYLRLADHRGYFAETYKKSDFYDHPEMSFMKGVEFQQCNESFSKTGTIRGLHFQWNPYMGKLVRTINGRMVDLILDIRKNSPSFGKIIAYDMPYISSLDYGEWIWIPIGFAHGNFFTEDSRIEYFCSSEYSPGYEAGISPFASDIDWSLCERKLKNEFDQIKKNSLITDKDKKSFSLSSWIAEKNSDYFVYDKSK